MTTNAIYKAMKHYRTKFLIIEIILIVVFVCFFTSAFPYVSNIFTGAGAFDESYYSDTIKTIEVGEEFELHRNDEMNIPDFALKGSSHWQDGKYEFIVPLEDVKNIGITYTNVTTGTGSDENKDDISAVLYLAKIGGKDTLVLAYPHQDLTKLSEVSGIFTSIPKIVRFDVARNENFSKDDRVGEYMLDTRGLEMESEQFDLVFSIVMFALVLFLGIKVIRQYKNYRITPTYRQLEKYGMPDDIASAVCKEMEGREWVKGECQTDSWIVKKDIFKLVIIRNYRTHGQFEYVKK